MLVIGDWRYVCVWVFVIWVVVYVEVPIDRYELGVCLIGYLACTEELRLRLQGQQSLFVPPCCRGRGLAAYPTTQV